MATEDEYLNELMARITAIQLEALADYEIAAKPFFFWWQEDPPYMINRLGRNEPTDVSEDIDVDTYFVQMRLVIGHITEGVPGELDEKGNAYVPLIQNKFKRNPRLTSTEYSTPMNVMTGARIISFTGFTVFAPNLGFPTIHVGYEWTLRCPFAIYIDEEY